MLFLRERVSPQAIQYGNAIRLPALPLPDGIRLMRLAAGRATQHYLWHNNHQDILQWKRRCRRVRRGQRLLFFFLLTYHHLRDHWP